MILSKRTWVLGSAALAVMLAGQAIAAPAFYAVTGNFPGPSQLVLMDVSAGTASTVNPILFGGGNTNFIQDADFDGSGNLIGVRQNPGAGFPPSPLNILYQIDTTTAAATFLSSLTFNPARSLAYRPANGQFYSVNQNTGRLATLDVNTGLYTNVSAVGLGLGQFRIDALAFAPNGDLYGVYDAGSPFAGTIDSRLVRIDVVTGLATMIGPIGALNTQNFTSLRFDPGSGIAYTVEMNLGTVNTVNLTTGLGTAVFTDSDLIGTTGLAFIPSPGAAALLLLTGAFAARRRR